jgi:hypothetical protein
MLGRLAYVVNAVFGPPIGGSIEKRRPKEITGFWAKIACG